MQDKWGSTALMAACWNNHINTARILVDNGAIVDLKNKVIGESSKLISYTEHTHLCTEELLFLPYKYIGRPVTTLCC